MKTWMAAIAIFAASACSTAWAAPRVLNYQGRLTNPSGNPITTPVSVTFTFWDAETTGTQLGAGFSDTDTVTPDADGIYSTDVGDDQGNLVPQSVFAGNSVWLNVNVAGEDLVPRLRITSVGFAIHASQADTATNSLDAFGLQGLYPQDFLLMNGFGYVIVPASVDAPSNGYGLLFAYAAAKEFFPNSAPLSPTNRAVVILPPAHYDLGSASLVLDADYVDLVGLSTLRDDQVVISTHNVIVQTARDVHIENLVIQYAGPNNNFFAYSPEVLWDDGITTHTGSPPETTVRNCEFRVASDFYASMKPNIEYAGVYEDCVGTGSNAFGGGSNPSGGHGKASGTFINCVGFAGAFGGFQGVASGTFTRCVGGDYSFCYFGTASGTFTDCTGGYLAFGGNGGTASGTFVRCTGGTSSFGGQAGKATGTFIHCIGGNNSFGSDNGLATGTFNGCIGGDNAFGTGSIGDGARFYYCVGGANSFTNVGSPPPIRLYCVRDGLAY